MLKQGPWCIPPVWLCVSILALTKGHDLLCKCLGEVCIDMLVPGVNRGLIGCEPPAQNFPLAPVRQVPRKCLRVGGLGFKTLNYSTSLLFTTFVRTMLLKTMNICCKRSLDANRCQSAVGNPACSIGPGLAWCSLRRPCLAHAGWNHLPWSTSMRCALWGLDSTLISYTQPYTQ